MKTARLIALLTGSILLSAASAHAAEDPLASYRGNLIACLNEVTRNTCMMWIGSVWKQGDDGYLIIWDRGPQQEMPTPGGNFRMEGRDGTFTLKGSSGAQQICLNPHPNPHKQYQMEKLGELYAGKGCYEFAPRKVGDKWQQRDAQGRTVTFWLLEGR